MLFGHTGKVTGTLNFVADADKMKHDGLEMAVFGLALGEHQERPWPLLPGDMLIIYDTECKGSDGAEFLMEQAADAGLWVPSLLLQREWREYMEASHDILFAGVIEWQQTRHDMTLQFEDDTIMETHLNQVQKGLPPELWASYFKNQNEAIILRHGAYALA